MVDEEDQANQTKNAFEDFAGMRLELSEPVTETVPEKEEGVSHVA
jgi:hypothetical protein